MTASTVRQENLLFCQHFTAVRIYTGTQVFSLAERLSSLYIAALSTLRFDGAFTPLFSAFSLEPICCMEIGEANGLITTKMKVEDV